MKNSHAFFQNNQCAYFPCHSTKNPDDFNCLFCYCPLYVLGEDCGGNYQYLDNGIKDCSACLLPHSPAGYDYIQHQSCKLMEMAKKR